jgi:hypothetical protein
MFGYPEKGFLGIDLSNDEHNGFWESLPPSRSYSEEKFQSFAANVFGGTANGVPAFLPSQTPRALKKNEAEASGVFQTTRMKSPARMGQVKCEALHSKGLGAW